MLRRLPLRLSILILLAFLAAFAACEEGQVVDKTDRSEDMDSAHLHASRWADSVMKTMDGPAMIRQLLMIPAPTASDSARHPAFFQTLRRGYGGVLLPTEPAGSASIGALQDSSTLPLWIAADLDTNWFRIQGLPPLIQLGATTSDTLSNGWGNTVAAMLASSGVNLAFISAGRTVLGNVQENDALGADPQRVLRQSQNIVSAFRAQGLQPVLRPLPSIPQTQQSYPRSASALANDLLPYRFLAASDSVFAQSTFLRAPKIDAVPSPHCSKITRILRQSDSQILFSPVLGGPDSNATAESALKCLNAGHDALLLNRHAGWVETQLIQWLEDGSLPMDSVRKKVRRILIAKTLQSQSSIRPTLPSIPAENAMEALGNWVLESSITVLRDNNRKLPVTGGLSQLNFAVMSLPGQSFRDLNNELSVYGNVTGILLDTTASSLALQQKILTANSLTIVPFFPEKRWLEPDGKLKKVLRERLMRLDSSARLMVVNFGPVSALAGLESLKLVVQAWNKDDGAQQSVARLVVGAQGADGTIPMQCGPMFCVGDGIPKGGSMRLAYGIPEAVGADPAILARIDEIIETAIERGAFPGCQVLAAKGGRVFYHRSFGHHDYSQTRPVTPGDLYDIASVTKIAATTLMAMHIADRDTAFRFDKPLKAYLPELDSSFITIKDITLQELMLHRAGLPAGLPIYSTCVLNDSAPDVRARAYADKMDTSHTVPVTQELFLNKNYLDSLWLKIRRTPLDSVRGFRYSDMSMFLMQKVLERVAGCGLDRYVDSVFYRPMGLKTICYRPAERFPLERITPTENDRWWRNQLVHGCVHDPSAAMYGGVGGQAGLFSNAWDLAAIMHLLLNEGEYAGARFLQPHTIQRFTSRQPDSHRGLGFDMQRSQPVPGEGMVAWAAHPTTFGHLGFTGTCAWADPTNDVIFVFLSNRVYPDSQNKLINQLAIRQRVQQVVYEALRLVPPPEEMSCYVE